MPLQGFLASCFRKAFPGQLCPSFCGVLVTLSPPITLPYFFFPKYLESSKSLLPMGQTAEEDKRTGLGEVLGAGKTAGEGVGQKAAGNVAPLS